MVASLYFQFKDSWNHHDGASAVSVLEEGVFQSFRAVDEDASVTTAFILHDPFSVTVLPNPNAL